MFPCLTGATSGLGFWPGLQAVTLSVLGLVPELRGSQAVSHPSGQKRKHGPNCTEEGLRLGSVAARVLNWELQSPVHCPVACFCQVWWQPLC